MHAPAALQTPVPLQRSLSGSVHGAPGSGVCATSPPAHASIVHGFPSSIAAPSQASTPEELLATSVDDVASADETASAALLDPSEVDAALLETTEVDAALLASDVDAALVDAATELEEDDETATTAGLPP